jgi:hypothetical protein
MEYLGIVIQHLRKRLTGQRTLLSLTSANIVANIVTNIFKSSDRYAEAIKNVNDAVDAYSSSIGDLGVVLGITLLERVKEVRDDIKGLSHSLELGFQKVERPIRTIAGINPRILM